MLRNCEPLSTARQFLRRWAQRGTAPADVAARVLADAGLAPDSALAASLGVLLGAPRGEAASTQDRPCPPSPFPAGLKRIFGAAHRAR